MPTPTHSGSRPRIGLASSAVLATDMVIGAAGSLGFPRGIEARQSIILGKSAARGCGQKPEKAGFWPHQCPAIAIIGALKRPAAVSRPRREAIIPMKRSLCLVSLATVAA